MKSQQVALVQSSFARVFARKAELADRFYDHLFEALPEAKSLFRGDFIAQKEMFASVLASSLRSLSDPSGFEVLGQQLARSHARFRLTSAQMISAANALVAALEDVVADDLNADEIAAWSEAFTRLTEMMVQSD